MFLKFVKIKWLTDYQDKIFDILFSGKFLSEWTTAAAVFPGLINQTFTIVTLVIPVLLIFIYLLPVLLLFLFSLTALFWSSFQSLLSASSRSYTLFLLFDFLVGFLSHVHPHLLHQYDKCPPLHPFLDTHFSPPDTMAASNSS